MKNTIEHIQGVGEVLVRKSEDGEPLFVGVVKLGKKNHYSRYATMAGTLLLLGVLRLVGVI